jgi:cytidylate kinase
VNDGNGGGDDATAGDRGDRSRRAFLLGAAGAPAGLAGWIAGNRADMRTWLDAPAAVRAARTRDREEMVAEMQVREVIEADRYESYYDIDLSDQSIYDLSVNTARWSPAGTLEIVRKAVREYDSTVDEGAVRTPDLDV